MTPRNENVIVYCHGDEEDDSSSGHPLIYFCKDGSKIFCPYCSREISEVFKYEDSQRFKFSKEHNLESF